jgi:nicotinamide-nucleotide adenylyltransferase
MVTRGIFVGRFQPFHKGHLGAIIDILEEVGELVIIVGSAQYSHTLSNPFTVGERITMIKISLEEHEIQASRYWIVPVPDVNQGTLWVSQVVQYSPKFEAVFTNEPLTRRLFVEAGFPVKAVPFIHRQNYSASEIRKRMLRGEGWEELVPARVGAFIKEIEGVERLQDLNKTDKIV